MEDNKNFLGTYLTENGSTAVVVSRSAMVVDGKKQVIWVGFVRNALPVFMVWNHEGKTVDSGRGKIHIYDLKEAVREQAY